MTISSDRGKEWDWVLVSTANIQEMCVSVKSFSLLFQVRINPPTAVLWFVQFNELVKKWNPVKKTQFLKRTATQDHFHVELINCFVYKMSKKNPNSFSNTPKSQNSSSTFINDKESHKSLHLRSWNQQISDTFPLNRTDWND